MQVGLRIEALSGSAKSMLSPYLLPQVLVKTSFITLFRCVALWGYFIKQAVIKVAMIGGACT